MNWCPMQGVFLPYRLPIHCNPEQGNEQINTPQAGMMSLVTISVPLVPIVTQQTRMITIGGHLGQFFSLFLNLKCITHLQITYLEKLVGHIKTRVDSR